jgi:hypothetical protein
MEPRRWEAEGAGRTVVSLMAHRYVKIAGVAAANDIEGAAICG